MEVTHCVIKNREQWKTSFSLQGISDLIMLNFICSEALKKCSSLRQFPDQLSVQTNSYVPPSLRNHTRIPLNHLKWNFQFIALGSKCFSAAQSGNFKASPKTPFEEPAPSLTIMKTQVAEAQMHFQVLCCPTFPAEPSTSKLFPVSKEG